MTRWRKATISDCRPFALFWTETEDMKTGTRTPCILIHKTEPNGATRPGNDAWMTLFCGPEYGMEEDWFAFQIQVGVSTHWYIREEEST